MLSRSGWGGEILRSLWQPRRRASGAALGADRARWPRVPGAQGMRAEAGVAAQTAAPEAGGDGQQPGQRAEPGGQQWKKFLYCEPHKRIKEVLEEELYIKRDECHIKNPPAGAGPGAPASPDELLPKDDAEKAEEELEEDDDEEPDETLSERLWGLTEMFPEKVRSAAGATFDLSFVVAQKMYRFSRAALWIGTPSFMILVLPVVFETEKLQMEQQQQLQQRQVLLGPAQDCREECQGLCCHCRGRSRA